MYDLVVIGTGPGGEGAAMQAVKSGKSVVAVERLPKIGGSCTHLGTIPSKALRHAIYQLTNVATNQMFRDAGFTGTLTFPQLRKSAASVIDKQVRMRSTFYERNGVDVHTGPARFRDANAVSYIITGHTDSRASDAYNMNLSLRRANSVARVAVQTGARIADVRGYGERMPKASNATAAGMQANRRVEIICIR